MEHLLSPLKKTREAFRPSQKRGGCNAERSPLNRCFWPLFFMFFQKNVLHFSHVFFHFFSTLEKIFEKCAPFVSCLKIAKITFFCQKKFQKHVAFSPSHDFIVFEKVTRRKALTFVTKKILYMDIFLLFDEKIKMKIWCPFCRLLDLKFSTCTPKTAVFCPFLTFLTFFWN